MYRRIPYLAMLATVLVSTTAFADKQPQTDQEKFSYAVGVQISSNLVREGIEIDPASFIQAIDDVLNHKNLKLSTDDMRQALTNYQEKEKQKQEALAAANKAAGEKFLADNKTKPGVVTTPSGLQYKVLKKGTGKKPTPKDTVVVNYEGRLIDGKVFDSSYKRGQPLPIEVDNVIKGWQEVLPMMPVGSKWQVVIPAELAYGDKEVGGGIIGPNSTLIFDIELMSIK